MKKVLLGAVAAIAITGAANAQFGTWYTDQAAWTAAVTSVQTENYTNIVTGANNVNSTFGGLVTSTTFLAGLMQANAGFTTVDAAAPVTFSFTSGNAFAFVGGVSDVTFNSVAGNMAVVRERQEPVHVVDATAGKVNFRLWNIAVTRNQVKRCLDAVAKTNKWNI